MFSLIEISTKCMKSSPTECLLDKLPLTKSLCHGPGCPIHYFFLPLSRAFVPRSIFSAALQIMTAMKPSSELAAVESPIIQVGRGREEGSKDGRGKESKGILPLPQAWYRAVQRGQGSRRTHESIFTYSRSSNLVCLLFTCVWILVFWVLAMEDANTAFRWKWVNPC